MRLFDLVDPEHDRRQALCDADGVAEALLLVGGVLEDRGDVEAQQRHLPEVGDRLGHEGLAAALDAQQEHAAGLGDRCAMALDL